jgi:outer membrane receptor protein involved in Fe transport
LPWRLAVELAAQAARGRTVGSAAYLDGITTETGSVQVRRSIGARAFAQARAARFAADDRPGPTERVVPGYTLIDLSAGVTLVRHLELRALVRNLADQTYFASQDVRAVSAPGRTASLTAVMRF